MRLLHILMFVGASLAMALGRAVEPVVGFLSCLIPRLTHEAAHHHHMIAAPRSIMDTRRMGLA